MKSPAGDAHGTVAQRIRTLRNEARRAELKVLGRLLEDYPMAGLVPVVKLAADSGVSTATVLRVVGKLGFEGYAAFQSALRTEVAARLFSPGDVRPHPKRGKGGKPKERDVLFAVQKVFSDAIRSTFADIDKKELNKAVDLLADLNTSVVTIGGQFSSILAAHLGSNLTMMRPAVMSAGFRYGDRASVLVNIGAKSTVVVYDYRRYQKDTIEWAIEAKRRGAKIILITDLYLSPLASDADLVLVSDTKGVSPFDSMATGHMLTDLIISLVCEKLGRFAQARIREFEKFRVIDFGLPAK
jgi:DNA-binding MurR/RpiR family transcriptional regulator